MDIDGGYIAFWVLFGGLVGAAIGSTRRQIFSGLVWGVILGPIGWVIVFMLPDLRAKCPECRGSLPDAQVRRCRHCGSELIKKKHQTSSYKEVSDPRYNKQYFVVIDNKEQGPFTFDELLAMWRQKEIEGKTLCAAPGDPKWQTLSELRG